MAKNPFPKIMATADPDIAEESQNKIHNAYNPFFTWNRQYLLSLYISLSQALEIVPRFISHSIFSLFAEVLYILQHVN